MSEMRVRVAVHVRRGQQLLAAGVALAAALALCSTYLRAVSPRCQQAFRQHSAGGTQALPKPVRGNYLPTASAAEEHVPAQAPRGRFLTRGQRSLSHALAALHPVALPVCEPEQKLMYTGSPACMPKPYSAPWFDHRYLDMSKWHSVAQVRDLTMAA